MTSSDNKNNNSDHELAQYVHWFRDAAPYINTFRNKIFVIYFGGELLADNQFPSLVHDLTLLHSLGVKLVLVHGARPQIDKKLSDNDITSESAEGLRITSVSAMEYVKEASGSIRFEIESMFSSSLRYIPLGGNDIKIVSGNFVTAKPRGIIDGIDYQHTGLFRRLDVSSIVNILQAGDIVLLSPLGFSPTGEVFNLSSEDVATQSAVALKADKLIFIDSKPGIFDKNSQLIRELTKAELKLLLTTTPIDNVELIRHYKRILYASESGIPRIHLVDRSLEGAILLELFTRQGIGTLVTADLLEDIRPAKIEDVNGIIALISPLEAEGVLVERSRERLETEINNFYLIERDNVVIGCGALYILDDGKSGELACLAISPEYRSSGRGEKLLRHIILTAEKNKLEQVFILTTQTAHWFMERGFKKVTLDDLPVARKKLYNYQRKSAVYSKKL